MLGLYGGHGVGCSGDEITNAAVEENLNNTVEMMGVANGGHTACEKAIKDALKDAAETFEKIFCLTFLLLIPIMYFVIILRMQNFLMCDVIIIAALFTTITTGLVR